MAKTLTCWRYIAWLALTCLQAYTVAVGPLGIAASQAVTLREKRRGKVPSTESLYDPETLPDDCAYASLLRISGVRCPTQDQVFFLRAILADLWSWHPQQLTACASRMQMTPNTYLTALRANLWGGIPEFQLYSTYMQQDLKVITISGQTVWESHPGKQGTPVLLWHNHHYTVIRLPSRKRDYTDCRVYKQLIRTLQQGAKPQYAAEPVCYRCSGGAKGQKDRSRSPIPPKAMPQRRSSLRCVQQQREISYTKARDFLSKASKSTTSGCTTTQEPTYGSGAVHNQPDGAMPSVQQPQLDYNDPECYAESCPDIVLRHGQGITCLLCLEPLTAAHLQSYQHHDLFMDMHLLTEDQLAKMTLRHLREARYSKGLRNPHMEWERIHQDQSRRVKHPHYQALRQHHIEQASRYQSGNAGTSARGGMYPASSKDTPVPIIKAETSYHDQAASTPQLHGVSMPLDASDPEQDESMTDADLEMALASLITDKESSALDSHSEGMDKIHPDLWGVIASAPPRDYVGWMSLDAHLDVLAKAIAITAKWPTYDVELQHDGKTQPLDISLRMLTPPYQFEVFRRTPLPRGKPVKRPRQGSIRVDLGELWPEQPPEHGPANAGDTHDESRPLGDLATATGDTICPSREDTTALQALESMQMAQHDHDVKQTVIQRPRDQLTLHYYEPMDAQTVLDYVASTKRVRRAGFTLYQRVSEQHCVQEGGAYFLTWSRDVRGGTREDDLSTTVSWHSYLSSYQFTHADDQARTHLRILEDLVIRNHIALGYMQSFHRGAYVPRIVTLAQCVHRLHARGGAPKSQPTLQSKWQSTRTEQGLKLHTQLVVQPDTEHAKVLESLPVEDFVPQATGYCLLNWDSWAQASSGFSNLPKMGPNI